MTYPGIPMLLSAAILSVLLDGLTVPDVPAPVALGGAGLFVVAGLKLAEYIIDLLKTRAIYAAEKAVKAEAEEKPPVYVAPEFIPESMEARIFKLEKAELEARLREKTLEAEELKLKNLDLTQENDRWQERVVDERRANARLRAKLRGDDNDRATDPIK